MMHSLILFCIHQNFNLVELLIYMGTVLTGILSKILIFTNLMLIHTMNIMTTQLIVVLTIQIHFSIMSAIFSNMDLFKYHNLMFNLKIATIIHSIPCLVVYLLMSFNRHF